MTSTTFKNKKLCTILAVLFWLLLWQGLAMAIQEEILIVSPFAVLKRLFALAQTRVFYSSIYHSLLKIMAGFCLSFVSGVLLAVIAHRIPFVEIILEPLILLMKSVPVASFIILVLLFVHSSKLSIVISFIMVLPIIYTGVLEGIENIDPGLKDMCDVFQLSNYKRIRFVYLFEVMPYLLSATKVSLGLCWKSGIAAEVIGTPVNSIGEKLYQAKIYFDTSDLFAWTLVIIMLSLCFQKIFLLWLDRLVKKMEEV